VSPWKIETPGLFQDRWVLAGTAVVLPALVFSAWLLFGDNGGGENEPAKRFTHLHCSVCREEVPYNPRLDGQTCGSCESGIYLPTVGSIQDDDDTLSPGARVVVFLLIAAVLLQGLAYVTVVRLRARRRAAAEVRNRMVVCHCPFCQRKIGYRATQAGSGVICSRCKTAFALPPVEEAIFATASTDRSICYENHQH